MTFQLQNDYHYKPPPHYQNTYQISSIYNYHFIVYYPREFAFLAHTTCKYLCITLSQLNKQKSKEVGRSPTRRFLYQRRVQFITALTHYAAEVTLSPVNLLIYTFISCCNCKCLGDFRDACILRVRATVSEHAFCIHFRMSGDMYTCPRERATGQMPIMSGFASRGSLGTRTQELQSEGTNRLSPTISSLVQFIVK